MSHHIDRGFPHQPTLVSERNIVSICVHTGAALLWLAGVLDLTMYLGFFTAAEVLSPLAMLYAYGTIIVCRYSIAALMGIHVLWIVSVIRAAQIMFGEHHRAAVILFILAIGLIVTGIYTKRALRHRYH